MGTDRERLIAAEQAPFRTLVRLVERELELASHGLLEELQEAVERTGAYMETLPQPAPDSAVALALRADAIRGRVAIELERSKERLSVARAALRRGRRIARKYGAPADSRISTSA